MLYIVLGIFGIFVLVAVYTAVDFMDKKINSTNKDLKDLNKYLEYDFSRVARDINAVNKKSKMLEDYLGVEYTKEVKPEIIKEYLKKKKK